MWGALSDEMSRLQFSGFAKASLEQPLAGLITMGIMSIFYCLYFSDSPNLEGQVPVIICPRNRVEVTSITREFID
jgi:hypothetical protein